MKTWFKKLLWCILLLVKATIVTILGLALWKWSIYGQVHIGDEPILTDVVLPGLITFHTILAAVVIAMGLKRMNMAQDHFEKKQMAALAVLIRRRIPGIVHLLIGTLTLILLAGCVLYPYVKESTGYFCIIALTFALGLFWVIAIELNDPTRGAWKLEECILQAARDHEAQQNIAADV